MTTATHDPQVWLPYGPPRRTAGLRLFCFPHAGAGAAAFRDWRGGLGRDIDVLPVQLPGRGTRLGEPPHQDMAALVGDTARALRPWLDEAPYAFLGHSMGALLAYEMARHLRDTRAPNGPVQLIVSGHRAPHLRWPGYTGDTVSEQEAAGMLRLLEGPGADEPDLALAVRPVLRADLNLCARYRHLPRTPLDIPVTALGGTDDPLVPQRTLTAWSTHTTGPFHSAVLPGGHFYLFELQHVVCGILQSRLRPQAASLRQPTGEDTR
ncbi:alpha/beta fold hydrolase [Streptomyces sp. NPDC006923]|uniref:thioesterase II family protein n=1 Tax=Streptomyces sp. NPDC006923 TaxID=3155355 RepID=UPI0033E14260